ncbi:MAG: hypothetical protein GY719_34640 [bacterium]|nr:hypothetical protein [bacterium]
MGGLMSSAVLTLVVLTYINWIVEFVAEWLKRLWRESGVVRAPRRAEPAPVGETVEAVG